MRRFALLLSSSLFFLPVNCSAAGADRVPTGTPLADVEAALVRAGGHRAELERVIDHFARQDDPQRLEAARFLIANMEGHCYVEAGLVTKDGKELPWNPLEFPNLGACEQAYSKLEAENGKLEFKRQRIVYDIETIPAELLIQNIELAFVAWKELPWAKALDFDTFKEEILPYRGSNEPAEPWREPLLERFSDLSEIMKDPADPREAGKLISSHVGDLIGFDDRFYMHPTDQGFAEMCERKRGRCEDITNMTTYCLRANAVASAADYTPWWANRDNNHAWSVILDAAGQGHAGLSSRAAKVYRKTFSQQRENLAFQLVEGEKAPAWLAGRTYRDVTEQYMQTIDVDVTLTEPNPDKHRFAYLCVFNGGEWRAIHWAPIVDGRAIFTKMGSGIAYLPAFYTAAEELVPAAQPFLLAADGSVQTLTADPARTGDAIMTGGAQHEDTDQFWNCTLAAGKTHDFFVWQNGWQKWGEFEAGKLASTWKDVPQGGLYWVVERGSQKRERIFTLRDGLPHYW